ncbi:MAG: nitrile hydratase subunit alpha [Chloroflexi bacterium]|nr:nitrile hydratase subunit alpha [Chloroflexota bacterium]
MSEQHHGHDHDSEQEHTPHPGQAPDIELSERAKRLLAMKELLIEKGVIRRGEIEQRIAFMKSRSPADGARVVARAWVDPAFRKRLLEDAEAAIAELGYTLQHSTKLIAVENTAETHNVIVCTLCSCYPTALLGPPPDWYKSLPYRSRVVRDPRSVLKEFGFEPPREVQVRVLDSTADTRFIVVPRRPEGTEGMTEEQLAELVTRDSMIGVTEALKPQAVSV